MNDDGRMTMVSAGCVALASTLSFTRSLLASATHPRGRQIGFDAARHLWYNSGKVDGWRSSIVYQLAPAES